LSNGRILPAEDVSLILKDEEFERIHTFGESQSKELRGELRRAREYDDRIFWKVKPPRWISRDISAGETINEFHVSETLYIG
jgi:hypothetical protein